MPLRFAELIRRLKAFGIEFEEPNSGSHWKARRGDTTYPIPAHNGEKTELSDIYVDGCCRAFGLDPDEVKERSRYKRLVKNLRAKLKREGKEADAGPEKE